MKDFIPHEPAFALKELGFDEPGLGYYLCRNSAFGIDDLFITTEWIDLLPYDSSSCKAPTFSQAFRWFREKFEIHSFIDCKWKNLGWEYELVDLNKMEKISCIGNYGYKTPEEAELACLRKLIEIVNNF